MPQAQFLETIFKSWTKTTLHSQLQLCFFWDFVSELSVCSNEIYWQDRMKYTAKLWNSWKITNRLYKPCLYSPQNNSIKNPPLPTKRTKIFRKFNERFRETRQPLGQRRSNVASANDPYHSRTIHCSQSVPLVLFHCWFRVIFHIARHFV